MPFDSSQRGGDFMSEGQMSLYLTLVQMTMNHLEELRFLSTKAENSFWVPSTTELTIDL